MSQTDDVPSCRSSARHRDTQLVVIGCVIAIVDSGKTDGRYVSYRFSIPNKNINICKMHGQAHE